MPAKLLEGKPIAKLLQEQLKTEVGHLKTGCGRVPVLASILVGDDPGSQVYVKAQAKCAEELGIRYDLHRLSPETKEAELKGLINELNQDKLVSAIIIQMPLPASLNYRAINQMLSPSKDAEAMHPQNLGKLVFGKARLIPCTPASVIRLLEETGVNLYGKETVVVGHSEIVGKPLALLLLERFATTTVCHIATGERGLVAEHVKQAEVLIVAVGKAGLIKGEWVKEGAIVIDVGINRVEGKIVGDVVFEPASQRASFITPVPGGVGPLTTMMLMRNTVEAFKLQMEEAQVC